MIYGTTDSGSPYATKAYVAQGTANHKSSSGRCGFRQLFSVFQFEIHSNLLVEMLNGHGGDVAQLLQHFMWSQLFGGGAQNAQDAVDLVQNATRYETADVEVNKLGVRHGQHRDPCFDRGKYVRVAG